MARVSIEQLLPCETVQSSDDDVRVRSHLIKLMTRVWKLYAKQIKDHWCPIFGFYSS